MSDYDKIIEWNRDTAFKNDSKLTTDLTEAGFTNKQILLIIEIIDGTCSHCWDGDDTCKCWDDS